MVVHLVDGTYELFRHFYAMPSAKNAAGEEVAAVRGVMHSIRGLVQEGATHIGVATDHVIESFRNHLWAGYKTGEGIAPELWAQFMAVQTPMIQSMMGNYIEQSKNLFVQMQEQMQQQARSMFQTFPFPGGQPAAPEKK